ncbi:MAG: hypothetical protein ACHREM_00310 [Polyangiales bacterium]
MKIDTVKRWAAMSPEEQWALATHLPTIIGPWTDSTYTPGNDCVPAYERLAVTGRRLGWCRQLPNGRWTWGAGVTPGTPTATAREAMQRSDELIRRTREWRDWTLVGGVPEVTR